MFNCWENFVLIPICTFSALLCPHISTLSQLLTSNTVHGHLRYKVSSRTFFLLELELKLFDSLNTIFLHFMSTTVLLLVLLRDTTHTLDHTADWRTGNHKNFPAGLMEEMSAGSNAVLLSVYVCEIAQKSIRTFEKLPVQLRKLFITAGV